MATPARSRRLAVSLAMAVVAVAAITAAYALNDSARANGAVDHAWEGPHVGPEAIGLLQLPGSRFRDWLLVRVRGAPYPDAS